MAGPVSISLGLPSVDGSIAPSQDWWSSGSQINSNEPFKSRDSNEKDSSIYAIDASPEMVDSGSLKDVIEVLTGCLKRKIIQNPDDLVSIVLYNTKNKQNGPDLDSVYVVREPSSPSASMIQECMTLHESANFEKFGNGVDCDFRDLLWVCQDLYSSKDANAKKYQNRRLFIFTKNDKPHCAAEDPTISKAKDMADGGIDILLFPLCGASDFKMKTFFYNIISADVEEFRSEADFFNSCTTLEELDEGMKVKETKKRSLASLPWTLKPGVEIHVKLYCPLYITKKDNPQWLDPRNNETLTCDSRFLCKDTGEFLDDTQYKTYLTYGREKVYFTKEEMKTLKELDKPGLRLMGFKPIDRLKDYHQMRTAYFMYPDEEMAQGSTVAFNSLLQTMTHMKKMAVCRFSYRIGTIPKLVAILPQEERIGSDGGQICPPGFYVIYLPYADDIRKTTVKPQRLADEDQVKKSKSNHFQITANRPP